MHTAFEVLMIHVQMQIAINIALRCVLHRRGNRGIPCQSFFVWGFLTRIGWWGWASLTVEHCSPRHFERNDYQRDIQYLLDTNGFPRSQGLPDTSHFPIHHKLVAAKGVLGGFSFLFVVSFSLHLITFHLLRTTHPKKGKWNKERPKFTRMKEYKN